MLHNKQLTLLSKIVIEGGGDAADGVGRGLGGAGINDTPGDVLGRVEPGSPLRVSKTCGDGGGGAGADADAPACCCDLLCTIPRTSW